MIHDVWTGIRHSLRALKNQPRLTAMAVLSLGLGVAASLVMFSVIYSALLRPLPYHDSARLAVVWETRVGSGRGAAVTVGNFLDWQQGSTAFESMGLCQVDTGAVTLTGDGYPELVQWQYVTPGLFDVLGARAAIGRTFSERDKATAPRVMLSHGFWMRRFGGDPQILSRTVTIRGRVFQILGVMPPGFYVGPRGREADIWRELGIADANLVNRQIRWLMAIGRLKPGVTIAQAEAELRVIAEKLAATYPTTNDGWTVALERLRDVGTQPQKRLLYPLFGAVGFVLLIACTNVINLFVARAAGRKKEMAMRQALGAGRARIVGHFVRDAIVLAALSGGLAIVLARVGLGLIASLAPSGFEYVREAGLDWPVLAFTAMVALVTGLAIGLAVAAQSSIGAVSDTLKESGVGLTSGRRRVTRTALTVVEIALAFVLLAGTGLLMRTLLHLSQVELGFETARIVTGQVDLTAPAYVQDAPKRDVDMRQISPKVPAFFDAFLDRVRVLPSVESAALVSWLPLGGPGSGRRDRTFGLADRPELQGRDRPAALYNAVSADYFRTLRIPLVRGRAIEESDTDAAPWVVVVNRALADRYWPGTDPIGQSLTLDIVAEERPRQVVGLIENVRQNAPSDDPAPEMYVAYRQQPLIYPGQGAQNRLRMTVVARTTSGTAIVPEVRRVLAELDKDRPLLNVRTLDDVRGQSSAPTRFLTVLVGIFAILAALLAAIGIYALTSHAVADRMKEFSIRLALGAQPGELLQQVLRSTAAVAAVGAAIGVGLSLWAGRFLASQLYGVTPLDSVTFAAAALCVVAIAMIAAWQPARRALRADVTTALRTD